MQFSNFSRGFRADSGILQLMDDLGKAQDLDGDIFMLGGGNPAAVPRSRTGIG